MPAEGLGLQESVLCVTAEELFVVICVAVAETARNNHESSRKT